MSCKCFLNNLKILKIQKNDVLPVSLSGKRRLVIFFIPKNTSSSLFVPLFYKKYFEVNID